VCVCVCVCVYARVCVCVRGNVRKYQQVQGYPHGVTESCQSKLQTVWWGLREAVPAEQRDNPMARLCMCVYVCLCRYWQAQGYPHGVTVHVCMCVCLCDCWCTGVRRYRQVKGYPRAVTGKRRSKLRRLYSRHLPRYRAFACSPVG